MSSATADGPVTPVPLEIAVTEATGLRCAVTGVGPDGLRAGRRRRRGRGQGGPRRARHRPGGPRGGLPASRSPPCSPSRTFRSTSATTRRSTARGSAAGRARCSRAARHRGVSDAGPRHGRLGPARAADDRRARGARARGRGAPAPPERRARVRAGARRRARCGRRRGRCGRVRRGRPRRREGRRRRHAARSSARSTSAAPRRSSRPAGLRACARLVVVSSPSVGYESTPTVGAGASTPITQRQRSLLVLGVEGRGRARRAGGERRARSR